MNEDAATRFTVSSSQRLRDVVEEAYRVFRYPKPSTLGVCERCCMDRQVEKDFLRPDIRDLPLSYVRDWFSAAADTNLSKAVWGYLLPRILEILALGEEPSNVGLEVSLKRFPTGDKSQWSEAEWAVLDRFAREYLAEDDFPDGCMLDDVLCMFAVAAFPLDVLIAQVESWETEKLVTRLWTDWCKWTKEPVIWISTFWEAPHTGDTWSWYTSDALLDRVLTFGTRKTTPKDLATKALQVAEIIQDAQ